MAESGLGLGLDGERRLWRDLEGRGFWPTGIAARTSRDLTFNVETDIIDWTATVVVSFAMRATPEVSFRCHLDLLEMRELVGVNIQVEL